MNSLEDLIKIEDEFQKYLIDEEHFSFIGPVEMDLFEKYANEVSYATPPAPFIQDVFKYTEQVRKVAATFEPICALRIFIVEISRGSIFTHGTIENYVKQHDIDYKPNKG